MLDINVIKNRLTSLSNTGNKGNRSEKTWKPVPGKQTVRIVPYAFNPDNPFIELKFHYNLNGKTYLSPDSFNRPDPIVEFSNKMKKTGDKEQWKIGKKLEPKMRTYAPVIVRGQEDAGVRFWGFGKQVYQQLLGFIADPDYGDITDLANGRDIVVEFKTAEEAGKSYPETGIRVKPSVTPAVDPTRKDLIEKIKNQINILELFPELSYDELKGVMDAWLHTEDDESTESTTPPATNNEEQEAPVVKPAVTETVKTKSPTTQIAKAGAEDLNAAFANLFDGK
jgi:hypothetical protein